MPKPEILDPQGQAVAGALHRLGVAGVSRRAAGQALRARGRRRGRRRDPAPHRRQPAGQPGDRGLDGDARGMRDRRHHLPGHPRRRRRRPRRPPRRRRARRLWHADHDLRGVDARGRPGRLLLRRLPARRGHRQPAPRSWARSSRAADRGMPVLGICNGFQILCEAGLLPGALVRNAGLHFVCRDQRLRVESAATAWTGGVRRGPGDRRPAQVGGGSLRRRRRHPRAARGRRPGRLPLRRRRPERVDGRHRRDQLGGRPGRRA